MASHNTLRQVSRILQNNRAHLNPSRTRQYSSHTFFISRPLHRAQSIHPRRYNVAQQTRALSLWGSSKSTPTPDTTIAGSKQADLLIRDPSDLDASARAIKASSNTAADTSFDHSTRIPHEPKIIEDAQSSLLQPHGSSSLPAPETLTELPERIGYLREVCGLDFGYGPTSVMSWILEHTHVWGGMSWTASIVIMSIILRSSMIPLLIEQSRQSAKMREWQIAAKPVQAELREAHAAQNNQKVAQATAQMRSLKQEYGVKFSRAFLPAAIQLPFGFGAWRILRNAADLPVPAFVQESWLWATDLSFSDPYYIMPAAAAGLTYLTLKLNANAAKVGAGGVGGPDLMSILKKIMPGLSFLFVWVNPGAVQIYFVTSAAMGLLTARLLQMRAFRTRFDLPLLPHQLPPEEQPAAHAAHAAAATEASNFLRTRAKRNVIDVEARPTPTEQPENPRSGIDKAVDKLKGHFTGLKGDARGFMENWTGSPEERAAKHRKNQDEQYEATVRAALDRERQERNRKMGIEERERRGQ